MLCSYGAYSEINLGLIKTPETETLQICRRFHKSDFQARQTIITNFSFTNDSRFQVADTLVSPTGTHRVWQVSRVVKGVEISRRGNFMLQSLNFINLVEPEHKIVIQ